MRAVDIPAFSTAPSGSAGVAYGYCMHVEPLVVAEEGPVNVQINERNHNV